MSRAPRTDVGDYVYHVINRSNNRARMFHTEADYKDFEYLLSEVCKTFDIRVLAYTIMPNHWHLLLYSRQDGDLGKALHWLTTSHVRRHHTRYKTIGHGHLYQGTYKSFLVQTDAHLLTVIKYIERNAVRAMLSKNAQSWKWGSAFQRVFKQLKPKIPLAQSPVPLPRQYKEWINDPEPQELLKDVRRSVNMSVPYGVVDIPNKIMQ